MQGRRHDCASHGPVRVGRLGGALRAERRAAARLVEDRSRDDAALSKPCWRLDTSNPPGNEYLVVDYLKQVFDKEGIPSEIFASDPKRSNIVARLKGSGRKRPLLIVGHSDVVTTDAAKWKLPGVQRDA
mgnify:CR=1 FL=1